VNWIWKCSDCDQTCTRLWNLKIHIQRKHSGLGRAIKQNKNNTKFNGESERFESQGRDQNQLYGQEIQSNVRPDFGFKGTRQEDFIDKFLVQIHKISEIKNLVNQSSPGITQYGPKCLISYTELSGLNRLRFFLGRSFHLTDDPLMDNVVAYQGYICRGCLMICIIPTYGFKETGKIVEAQHDCDRRFVTNNVQYPKTNILNISNNINNLNQKLLKELKNIINKWTDNEPCLAAISCSGLKELTELPSLNGELHSWARSTILVGQSILSDSELLDFLIVSGNKTCGFFNLKTGEKNDSYFMWISRPSGIY
jgi:hypothetical protein